MPPVTITLDEVDFGRLWTNSMGWAGAGWDVSDHAGRFESVNSNATVQYTWKHAYWMGDSWASVVLARSYLAAVGHEYQVVTDTIDDPALRGYVVLTDYQDPAVGDRPRRSNGRRAKTGYGTASVKESAFPVAAYVTMVLGFVLIAVGAGGGGTLVVLQVLADAAGRPAPGVVALMPFALGFLLPAGIGLLIAASVAVRIARRDENRHGRRDRL